MKEEKTQFYLNSEKYYVIYCLYCLNTSKLKYNASVSHLLLSPLQVLFGHVTQCPLFCI